MTDKQALIEYAKTHLGVMHKHYNVCMLIHGKMRYAWQREEALLYSNNHKSPVHVVNPEDVFLLFSREDL